MVDENISKHNNNIVHIRKVDDLYKLDANKKWTLIIYKSAMDQMSENEYLQILNLCSNKNLNNKGQEKAK